MTRSYFLLQEYVEIVPQVQLFADMFLCLLLFVLFDTGCHGHAHNLKTAMGMRMTSRLPWACA